MHSKAVGEPGGRRGGEGDLKRSPQKHQPCDRFQTLDRKLEPDRKQEKDDPHFGEDFETAVTADEFEAVRTRDRPDDQQASDGRQPDPPQNERYEHPEKREERQLAEDRGDFVHGPRGSRSVAPSLCHPGAFVSRRLRADRGIRRFR